MRDFHVSPIVLGLSLLSTATLSHAAWFYDADSCGSHLQILQDGMASATTLIQDAGTGFGGPAPAPNLWTFHNTEARDLAGRIFGAIPEGADGRANSDGTPGTGAYYYLVRNGLAYMEANFQTAGGAKQGNEGTNDVVFYCDLTRLQKQTSNSGVITYTNPADPAENPVRQKDFDSCNFNSVTAASVKSADMASTAPPRGGAGKAIVQICPWYLKQTELSSSKRNTLSKIVRFWWYNVVTFFGNQINRFYYKTPVRQIDLIALWDTTLVHELSHAIPSSTVAGAPDDPTTKRGSTTDVGVETGGAYGWDNIRALRTGGGVNNADSWAYFAIGIQQMQQGSRINDDGTMSAIAAGNIDIQINNHITIDDTFAPTKRLRSRYHYQRESRRSLARENRRSASANPSVSVPGGNSSSLPFGGTGTAPVTISSSRRTTGSGKTSSTSVSGSKGSKSSTGSATRSASGSTTSSSLISTSQTASSSTSSTNSGAASVSGSSSSGSLNPSSSSSTSVVSTSAPQTSSPVSSKSSSQASSQSSSQTTTTSSLLGGGGPVSSTTIVSTSGNSVVTITTGIPIPTSSSTSSSSQSLDTDTLYIFSPTTTTAVTATFTIGIANPTFTPTIPTGVIVSIATDTGFYIPSITNIAAFPTIKVKNPDPKDKDQSIIPFVKISLPSDKCSPLPKPQGGGLFGLVFHLAADVVDGVLDAACHLVVPIIPGIVPPTDLIPPWLFLSLFPLATDFPDDPENDPTSTPNSASSTASKTSSSSCSASTVPHCTASCAISTISGSTTSSCATTCASVTACSVTASTTTVSSSATLSSASIIDHDAPSSTEYFGAQQSLLDSLISGAPTAIPTTYIFTETVSSGSAITTRGSSSKSTSAPSSSTTGFLSCVSPRPSGAPSGEEIAKAIRGNTTFQNFEGICAAKFDGSGNSTSETFNHGSIDIILQRDSDTQNLTDCAVGLNSIVEQCILNGTDYGGYYIQNAQKYNISNSIYPANPLIPGVDEGAPPVSSTPPPPPPSTTATPTSAPPPPPPPPSSTIPYQVLVPTSTSVSCITNADQTDLGACQGGFLLNPSQKYCTNDPSVCISTGTTNSNGIDVSSYCWIGGNQNCAIVVANKLSSFGFPGFSCFTGQQLRDFVNVGANTCGGNAAAVQQGPNGFDSFCMVDKGNPSACAA